MFEIEFSTGRWIEERKDILYSKHNALLSSRKFRLICLTVFCVCVIGGLFFAVCWASIDRGFIVLALPYYGLAPESEQTSAYMVLMTFCAAAAAIALLLLVNSMYPLRIHLPGTKLDYDGHYPAETFHLSFGTGHFTVIRNGENTDLKYTDIHRVFRDRRGLLLADIDLYIPLEILTKSERKLLTRRFRRPQKKRRRGSGT